MMELAATFGASAAASFVFSQVGEITAASPLVPTFASVLSGRRDYFWGGSNWMTWMASYEGMTSPSLPLSQGQ